MDARSTSAVHDLGLLLIRIMLGVVFMFHGGQKLFGWFDGPGMEGYIKMIEGMEQVPMPKVSAYLSACTEFIGGLLLLVGFLTRLVAIPLVINMLAAVYLVHRTAFSGPSGMEFPLTLAVVTAGIALTGAGCFSIDGCLWRRTSSPATAGVERERAT